jgi:hypothetical protein
MPRQSRNVERRFSDDKGSWRGAIVAAFLSVKPPTKSFANKDFAFVAARDV